MCAFFLSWRDGFSKQLIDRNLDYWWYLKYPPSLYLILDKIKSVVKDQLHVLHKFDIQHHLFVLVLVVQFRRSNEVSAHLHLINLLTHLLYSSLLSPFCYVSYTFTLRKAQAKYKNLIIANISMHYNRANSAVIVIVK